jgi:hypothetical protein
MIYVNFASDVPPVDASKLRVRGGRVVEYDNNKYKIQSINNSPRKGKKYVAVVQNMTDKTEKKVHWGASGYDDYYVHKDKKRRENFQKRHGAIKTKDGRLASENPLQASYYATKANWCYMGDILAI